MNKRSSSAGELPSGEAFRTEWIDFEQGIRVGRLEPHERITQILKFHLEGRHGTPFVIDRWGRGVFWQWICWLPRANREAKPLSNKVNFGCVKLFISADRETRTFKAGLQVERGFVEGAEAEEDWGLRDDWDWHRLIRQCRKGQRARGSRDSVDGRDQAEGVVVGLAGWINQQQEDVSGITRGWKSKSWSRSSDRRKKGRWINFGERLGRVNRYYCLDAA